MFKKISALVLIGMLSLVVSACAAPAQAQDASSVAKAESENPEAVVEAFYGWYLDYIALDRETGSFNNPMVDRAYHSSPYLTAEFEAQLDAIVEEGLHYDPFLQAQDVPEYVTVESVSISPMDEEARVRVTTSFEGHVFEVYLQLVEGRWQIANIYPLLDEDTHPPA